MGIPYLYEFPANVRGYGIMYPDFTLLNIKRRKEFYFEHFGMMDDEEYSKKAFLKSPLNMQVVEKMLKEFLLK